jgi:hypothetical protein
MTQNMVHGIPIFYTARPGQFTINLDICRDRTGTDVLGKSIDTLAQGRDSEIWEGRDCWMLGSESFTMYKELIESGFFSGKSAELRYMLEIMESSRHLTHEQCEELRGLVGGQPPQSSEGSE